MRKLATLFIVAFLPIISVQAQEVNSSEFRVKKMMANYKDLTGVDADGCLKKRSEDEIVVCANSDPNRDFRLPFPELAANSIENTRTPKGEIPSASAAPVRQGSCGVVGFETGCTKGGIHAIKAIQILGSLIGVTEGPDSDDE